ncbi:DUF3570 domain-containing protein [Oceanobacter mangrovi]|uniref:DUF3570 domain-containing protein n=1 Tax=Oceanobacter mangrovi TaxID=2862510 RepID=UPI001C8E4B2D|nr:DUF3570 domain-containing protein [Oceanobacter mangrovi]
MQLNHSTSGSSGSRKPDASGDRRLTAASVAGQLALATATLLGHSAEAADQGWQVDSGLLIYQEADDRVSAVEPALDFVRQVDEDTSLRIHLVYDTLTGASPNGAMPANKPQTFTSASSAGITASSYSDYSTSAVSMTRSSPSSSSRTDHDDDDDGEGGGSTYTAAAGERPLDQSFEDQRYVVGLGWTTKLTPVWQASVGGSYSTESDFTSYSVNGAIARELNNKNTTLSLGTNLEYDIITPHGGTRKALSRYDQASIVSEQESKTVADLSLGLSQVFTRRWISRFNLGVSHASGYQADPYKFLTVAADGNLIDSIDSYLYLYESRPEQRTKYTFYWQNKLALTNDDVLDTSWRYMTDDWGIRSHTADMSLHWQLGSNWYLKPHYRWYRQTAADFYKPFLQAGSDVTVVGQGYVPQLKYASADGRLGAFSAVTTGLQLGYQMADNSELSIALERYRQIDNNRHIDVPQGSDLSGMDQFAETRAWWLRARYSFHW